MPRHITETGMSQIVAYEYLTIAAAIAAVGSDNKELVIGNSVTFTSDTIIPSNIVLRVSKGGMITINAGVSITISGDLIAGRYQIFTYGSATTSNVYFSNVGERIIFPEWWGAKGDGTTDSRPAMNYAATSLSGGGEISLDKGIYSLSRIVGTTQHRVRIKSSNISIVGEPGGNSVLLNDGSGGRTVYITLDGYEEFTIRFPGHPELALTPYDINTIVQSSNSVTFTTLGNAVHFSTGDDVLLISKDNVTTNQTPYFFQFLTIGAIDYGTGVATLKEHIKLKPETNVNWQLCNIKWILSNFSIRNVTFMGSAGNQHMFTNWCKNVLIENCKFVGGGPKLTLDTTTANGPIGIGFCDTLNATIRDCYFYGCSHGMTLSSTENLIVANNYVLSCDWSGIILDEPVMGAIISNNIIDSCNWSGISASRVCNFVMENNIVTNCAFGTGAASVSSSMYIKSCKYGIIKNNILSSRMYSTNQSNLMVLRDGSATDGYYVDGYLNIEGNHTDGGQANPTIHNGAGASFSGYSSRSTTAQRQLRIVNNQFTEGVHLEYVSYSYFNGNRADPAKVMRSNNTWLVENGFLRTTVVWNPDLISTVPGRVSKTLSMPGTVAGDKVIVSTNDTPNVNCILDGYVGANDYVTISWFQVSGTAFNPSNATYYIYVYKPIDQ